MGDGVYGVPNYLLILFLFFLTEPCPILVDETAMRIRFKITTQRDARKMILIVSSRGACVFLSFLICFLLFPVSRLAFFFFSICLQ